MPRFEVDFSYKLEEFGIIDVEADGVEDAETQAKDYVLDTFPDSIDVTIEAVREIPYAR